jgi:hypothetical protein
VGSAGRGDGTPPRKTLFSGSLTPPVLKDPAASAAAELHADWLELLALKAADRNSSIQDIQRVFSRAGTTDAVDLDGSGEDDDADDRGSERSQQIAEDAFAEIERRRVAVGDDRYPFSVSQQALQATPAADASTYVFLLLLSKFGIGVGPAELGADEMFEEVCASAAEQYFGGATRTTTYQFGFPRRIAPAGFREALDDMCRQAGEGAGSKNRPRRKSQKDAKLDLAVWNDFHDERPAKLMAFAQCATGSNWKSKLTHMQPLAWCNLWMQSLPGAIPIRAFFVPHSVESDYWDEAINYGGMMFDRTRIARFATPATPLSRNVSRWSKAVLRSQLRG